MADEGIFATTAEVQRKTGEYANATSNTEAYINQFMTEAESLINCTCRYNYTDAYPTLNVDVKGILKMAASAWAAIGVIRYNMDGFTSRQEALTMINSLLHEYNMAIKELKDKSKIEPFILNA